MNLPQEIIDSIVDYVHDDRRTLVSLRLLNHSWNVSASLHLFRTVDFNVTDYSTSLRVSLPKLRGFDRPERFLSLLKSGTETISHCVRRVQIRLYPTKGHYAVLLLSIVSRFTHMSDIVFRRINWSILTPSFSSCILAICKSPKLEQIDFWGCSMPTVSSFLDILQASSNLKTLRLLFSDIKDSEPSSSSSSENQYCTNITTPLLSSLTVHGGSDRLLHVFKLDKLRKLNWSISHDNVSSTEFLKSVGQSLESLVIGLAHVLSSIPQVDLSHCPRLQHLRISGLRWSLSICPSTYFSSLFVRIPDQSLPIERLELVIRPITPRIIVCADEETSSELAGLRHQCQPQCQHDDDNGVDRHPGKLCYSGWLTIDESLSRSRIFQSLKTLEILVHIFEKCGVDLSSLPDTFPKLKNKGVQLIWTTITV